MSRLAAPPIAVVLLALVVAGCSGSVGASTPKPVSTSTPTVAPGSPAVVASESTACLPPRDPVAPPEAESVVATIALGCEGGAVAIGGGSVWVVPHFDPIALRIDPVTNTVIDRISLGDSGPGAEIDGTDEMIWASVSSPSYNLERLVRIDPASGRVIASVDAPAGFPAIGPRAVWATGPAGIYRIDPEENTVAAVIQAGDCRVVTLDDRAFCVGPEGVVSVDAATDRTTKLPGEQVVGQPIFAFDGLVWGVDGSSLWAVDPTTGRRSVDLEPPEGSAAWGPDGVVVDGALWATAGHAPDRSPDRLVRIDRESSLIDCVIEIPEPEFGMAAGFGSIWFSVVRQPWLVRIDPSC
jgi:hypothetical protein